MAAAIDVETKISGLDGILEKMSRGPENVAKKGLRKALMAGANPIWKAMSAGVRRGWHVWASKSMGRSRDYGFISQHIGIQVKMDAKNENGAAHIGPVKKGFWSMFLEFGTSKMPAYPFVRPAFDTNKEAALTKFTESLRQTFEEEFKK